MIDDMDLAAEMKKLKARMGDFDAMASLLKNEMSGLRNSMGSLLAADKEKHAALEGWHQAYAAAAQRAELAEMRAARAAKQVDQLEIEVAALKRAPTGGE